MSGRDHSKERDGEVLDGVNASKQYDYSCVVKEKNGGVLEENRPVKEKIRTDKRAYVGELTIQTARKREQRGLQN